MTLILIISLLVVAAAFAIYQVWVKLPEDRADRVLAPPARGGLFDEPKPEHAEQAQGHSQDRRDILARAAGGDLGALSDACDASDPGLYGEVLDALVEHAAGRQDGFRALVTHISDSEGLRANAGLAKRVIEEWKAAPGRGATIEMLHISALSDDAATYLDAVETVLEYWQDGQLTSFTKDEICDLVESQYWVLTPEARRTGAGFALKDRLAGIRRKLAAARPAS